MLYIFINFYKHHNDTIMVEQGTLKASKEATFLK